MTEDIFKSLNEKLFNRGETIAVAVSGGKDSMCLLELLLEKKDELGVTVKALNADHGIRGENSVRDSLFVKDYCKKRGVELKSIKFDCPKFCEENGYGAEEGARILRYAFFADAVKSGFCDKVATAHHLSDNAETFLFNLFRGAGSGNIGISETSGSVIRPILSATREEIDEFISDRGIPFVTDETNFSAEYTRNYLRGEIIPEVKSRFPSFEKALFRYGKIAEEEDSFLNGLAEKALKKRGKEYYISEDEEPCVFRRACVLALKKLGVMKDYEKAHIDAVTALKGAQSGKEVCLPKGVKAVKEYGEICLYEEKPCAKISVPFSVGEIDMGDCKVVIGKEVSADGKILYFDGAKIPAGATVRTREKGDFFRKFGGGKKSLGDYFTDMKTPKRTRDRIPLVCDGKEVLIVVGTEISDRVKTDDGSVDVLKIGIKFTED